MRNAAIIVAAGSGKRFGGPVPKPYLEIEGRPILAMAVEPFLSAGCIDEIVVVAAEDWIERSRSVFADEGWAGRIRITAGGAERFDSVYEGLLACPDADLVFIHDGARPYVSTELIERGHAAALEYGTAVAALPARETVKRATPDGVVIDTPNRAELWSVQTPQIFRRASILAAYEAMRAAGGAPVTDDAQVMELYGADPVRLYIGDARNIKITTPEDLF